jgi:hypothetical protein
MGGKTERQKSIFYIYVRCRQTWLRAGRGGFQGKATREGWSKERGGFH